MIKKLDRVTINKIAAGEVADRPVSVIRELVENALDAGASRIEIVVAASPLEKMSVSDNGSGIAFEEIPAAFDRHATSKISAADDLLTLDTLGFRGEALPSIASVSRCTLISSCEDGGHGGRIEFAGGKRTSYKAASRARGTTVIVEDLFYNIPARRKYLKSPPYETRLIREFAERIALIYADAGLEISLSVNGRTLLSTDSEDGFLDRMAAVCGETVSASLMGFEKERDVFRLKGWVSGSDTVANNSRNMNLFVNGRAVNDKRFVYTVKNALKEIIPPGKYPFCVVFIEIDPRYADFNVHPRKTEIRFRDENRIYGSIYNSVISVFAGFESLPSGGFAEVLGVPDAGESTHQSSLFAGHSAETAILEAESGAGSVSLFGHRYMGVVFGRYMLFASEDEMIMVDFHALNERLVYDSLKDRAYRDPGARIIPEVIMLGSAYADIIEEKAEDLRRVGFGVRKIGDDSVVIESIPVYLRDAASAEALLRDICGDLSSGEAAGPFDEYFAMRACKSSFRSGDRLSGEDVRAFAAAVERGGFSLTCPHGRPVARRLGKKDIDRLFKRL